jgi:predicted transcriptional regulator
MAVEPSDVVKLTETDFMILDKLIEGRNLAANIAAEIDRSRKYVNGRMPYLLDYDLVERVGPVEDTGLYELTEKGELVYEHRGEYHDDNVDFESFIDDRLSDSAD